MKKYIDEILAPILGDEEGLLLLDEFSAHKIDEIILYMVENKINPVFVPGGHTSLLQPLDVGINKPFKDLYKESWSAWFSKEDVIAEDFTKKAGNRRRPDWQLIIDWV